MQVEEVRKLELDALYKEISENSSKVYQVINICVLGTTAVTSYAFANADKVPFKELDLPFLLLLPFLLILPSIMLVKSSLNATARIAAYIKVVYERPGAGIAWQTSIQECRGAKEPSYRALMKGLAAIFVVLASLSILSSLVSFIFVIRTPLNSGLLLLYGMAYTAVVLLLVGLLSFLLSDLAKKWSGRAFMDWEHTWKEITLKPDALTRLEIVT